MRIESHVRIAIRDSVNRRSRKPFYWGGLKGYQQLNAIGTALHQIVGTETETPYFRQLIKQVDRTLEQNRSLFVDLQQAHTWLLRIADCLHYPPSSHKDPDNNWEAMTSQQIKQDMNTLLDQFEQDTEHNQVSRTLYDGLKYRWDLYGNDLLYCYDIDGLPPDNLQLESLFNRMRCHQRRISGRKSTKELRDFGQYQVLFMAESEEELLEQLRCVPLTAYYEYRRRLDEAEAPRRFLHRLHRNPEKTIQQLLDRYAERRLEITCDATSTEESNCIGNI